MIMLDLIAEHMAAWKRFQTAPAAGVGHAEAEMTEAMDRLLTTPCQSTEDAAALMIHLNWYAKEEATQVEPAALAMLAAMRWASA